ncbi:cell adhesion molecule Dscam2-like [Hetaerina americana]|uniref:cell adhesion molecule Dscam2-like n=1 Tax=Hetaerina americana TaxID=62018 RepID=UPI003A7F366D
MKAVIYFLCVALLNGQASSSILDSQGPVFVNEPRGLVEFGNDTGALIGCAARGSPPPKVEWVMAGDGSLAGPVPHVREPLANGSLHFPSFPAEAYRHDIHSAVYRCEAANSAGRILSREVNVRAVVKQNYEVQVNDAFVMNGNTAVLKCDIPAFVKDHVSITSWVQDSSFNIYPSPDSDGKYHMLPTGELLIYGVTPSDSRSSYRCRTVHHVTGRTVESTTQGRVVVTEHRGTVAPRFTDRVHVNPVKEGDTAVLSCVSQGYPPPKYWWFREARGHRGAVEPLSPSERVHIRDGVVVVRSTSAADAGKYGCLANNSAGSERVEVELSVAVPLSVSLHPPSLTIDVGGSAELSCVTSGLPRPSLSWKKDGLPLRPGGGAGVVGSRFRLMLSGAKLVFTSVQREDKGMYQCFARNDLETAQATAELRLGDAHPQLVYKFIEQTMQPGPSVSLKCIAAGNPTPHFTWNLDGFPLPQNDRLMIGQYVTVHGDVISHVNVSTVRVEDGGEYRCTASNRVGSASHSARLNIYGLPHIRPMPTIAAVAGRDLILKCPVAGFPVSLITWEKDGQLLPINRRQEVSSNGTMIIRRVDSNSDQGSYACVARNKHGHSDRKTVEIDVKVPPRIAPFSFNKDLSEGVRAQVTCVIEKGDPPFTISWLKDSEPIPSSWGLKIIGIDAHSSTIVLERVTSSHTGNFTCLAKNSVAEVSHTAELVVSVPPRWIVEPQDEAAAEGIPFALHCQADGFPHPTITWRKAVGQRPGNYRDLLSQESSGIRIIQSNGTLLLPHLNEDHEGYYLCEAVNGIGAGLSKVIFLTVNAPPHFTTRHSNQTTRLGTGTSLRCEVNGDKPMKIIWRKAGSSLDPATDYRYTVKEINVTNGVAASELGISTATREDSGRYYCIATNAFGRDESSIQLYIQEPPDFPRNLRVIERGSRSVKLEWILSQDGNSPITQYTVEYKIASDMWHGHTSHQTVPGNHAVAHIGGLRPATVYHFRLFAENDLGRSQASDILDVTTDGEKPGGPPRNIRVDALSSTELHVVWDPPERDLWNGDSLTFSVGFREDRTPNENYQYETVALRPLQGGGGECIISGLKKFTRYSLVVLSINSLGSGPQSEPVNAYTLEDVPSTPPQDVRCTAFTSQSLQVSWDPPPENHIHGLLKGYKVIWESSEVVEASLKPETKVTTASSVVVHGLEKFSNYSIQVLAYTRVGDGVASPPMFCVTEEDVPDAPAGIKSVVSSGTSVIVSWLPPIKANGIITTYNLHVRSVGAIADMKVYKRSLSPQHTSYEAEGLHKHGQYEFSVAAVTKIGEGPKTKSIIISPSTEVHAAIYSFGQQVIVPWKQEVRLPCQHVGKPEPSVGWRQWGQPVKMGSRFKLLGDGSLLIMDLRRDDSGNYTCHVENRHGSDEITHRLTVQVPPSAPLLHATSTSSSSINLQWKQGDDGGSPIEGFVLHYKKDLGDWEEKKVSRKESSHILNKLLCGTSYQMFINAYNKIGMGNPSETIIASTDGGKPGLIPPMEFISVNSTSVTLRLDKWNDGGCPILYFELNYRRKDEALWTQVSNSIEFQSSFTIKNLQPSTEYHLRVTAHNNAGSTTAEYQLMTLSDRGGIIPPVSRPGINADIPFYMDLKVILLLIVLSLAMIIAVFGLYFCFRKRRPPVTSASLQESQTAAALDNKQNMEQREQYYATVRKPLRSPVRDVTTLERIPEYSEDIYPYATFELNEPAVESRCTSAAPLQTFVYHDPRLTASETLQVRETDSDHYSKVRRARGKSRSFKSESEEYDTLGSDSDTEQGNSSRTESSNHLDDSTGPCSKDRKLQLVRYTFEAPRSSSRNSAFIYPPKLDPPRGFSDAIELSEADCDPESRHFRGPGPSMIVPHRPMMRDRRPRDFTIAV